MYTNKFSITTLSLFLLLFIVLGCLKDEEVASSSAPAEETKIENTTDTTSQVLPRNGQGDLVLYRGTLSTDNYLLVSTTNRVFRTHTVYNKDKVAYLSFRPGTLGRANIGGVISKHYNIEIKYKDSTVATINAFSKDTLDRFRFYPKGANLLHNSHPAKKLDWVYANKTTANINEWRGTTYTNLQNWNIYADGTFVAQKVKDPVDKTSTQFIIPHSHK